MTEWWLHTLCRPIGGKWENVDRGPYETAELAKADAWTSNGIPPRFGAVFDIDTSWVDTVSPCERLGCRA